MAASRSSPFLFYSLLVCICISSVWGLQVTPNSPCARLCIDDATADVSDPNVSNTNGSDIVCNDADYTGTAVGRRFKECLSCLQNSTAESGTENDQGWFLYNLRYAFSTCVYDASNASDPVSTPCATNTDCGPLQNALEQGLDNPSNMGGQYSYCTANDNSFTGSYLSTCQSCLRENSDVYYLSNFLVALDAGCIQEPTNGTTVGLNSTLFTNTQVAIISPVTTSQAANHTTHKRLSDGAIVGIAVAGVIVLLIASAITFICMKKRRNIRRLQKLRSPLDERFGAENITAPNKGAYSSPQASPGLVKDNIAMKQSPAVRNFSFSRPIQPAGEWTGVSPTNTPSTGTTFSSAGSPPGTSPPNSGRSIPSHHAYIPPDYTPPSRNSTSPFYRQPPQPPQEIPASYPQRSPSMSVNSASKEGTPSTSPNYTHRSSPSVASIRSRTRTPAPVNLARAPSSASRFNAVGHPSISPSLINTMPNPNPSPNYISTSNNPSPNYIGRELEVSGPISRATGSRFENDEEARLARERLYREGLAGRTLVHGKEQEQVEARNSPDSESSEELWPGSY